MRTKINFSDEDVVKYLYGEMNPSEKNQFELNRSQDETLFKELKGLENIVSELDLALWEPRRQTVDRIMEFSKNFDKHCVDE